MTKHNPYELDRVAIRIVKEPGGPLISSEPIDTPEKIAKLLHDEIFGDMDRELFAILNLKTDLSFAGMKVIHSSEKKDLTNLRPASINITSMGSINASIVHPRECVKSFILSNATAVILIHNHPSARLQPSQEDIQITDQLIQAYDLLGIPVLDHLILGPKEEFYSFHESNVLPMARNHYTTKLEDISFPEAGVKTQPTKSTKSKASDLCL